MAQRQADITKSLGSLVMGPDTLEYGCMASRKCFFTRCPWEIHAPSTGEAQEHLASHLVNWHDVDPAADLPVGLVHIRFQPNGPWVTTNVDRARELHREEPLPLIRPEASLRPA